MIDSSITQFAVEQAEAEGFAALGFDLKAFLIQLITFLLVFYILNKFVFWRIVNVLEKRRTTIEEGLKLTSEMKTERANLEKQIAEAHKQARADADKLLASTRAQADTTIKDAEESAKTKVDAMLADAKKKINEETERARRLLERETVELVIEATEAVTKEKLDANKDGVLIKNALKGRA